MVTLDALETNYRAMCGQFDLAWSQLQHVPWYRPFKKYRAYVDVERLAHAEQVAAHEWTKVLYGE